MSRLDDIRRLVLSLSLFLLFLSLLGSILPWVRWKQPEKSTSHTFKILNNTNLTISCPDGSSDLSFKISIFMNLASAEICSTFDYGILPPNIGGANLADIEMCTKIKYSQISNFMLDTNTWTNLSNNCKKSGHLTFFCLIMGILIMFISITINTFPNIISKCFKDHMSRNAKIFRIIIAFLSTIFIIIGLISFGMGCVHSKLSNDVTKNSGLNRAGSWGFIFACLGFVFNVLWMILFIIKLKGNTLPQIDTQNANSFVQKLVPETMKKKNEDEDATDYVDAEYNDKDIKAGTFDEDDQARANYNDAIE